MTDPKFLLAAIPKSGTHLLATIFAELYGVYPPSIRREALAVDCRVHRDAPVVVGHLRAAVLQQEPVASLAVSRRICVLIRHPVDLCVSLYHYLQKSPKAAHQQIWQRLQPLGLQAACEYIADGDVAAGLAGVDKTCRGFVEITQDSRWTSLLLRYEDIVLSPDATAGRLSAFCQTDEERCRAAVHHALEGGSRTKRQGGARAYGYLGSQIEALKLRPSVMRACQSLGYSQ